MFSRLEDHLGVNAPLLDRERNKLIFTQAASAIWVVVLVALYTAYILSASYPFLYVSIWLALVLCSYWVRYNLVQRFRRSNEKEQAAPHWRKRFFLSVLFSGLVWGSTAIFLFPENSVLHQAFLAMLLGALSTATTVTHAAFKGASLVFIIPAMLPITVQYFILGSIEYISIGGMLLLLMVVLLGAASHLHVATMRSLRLGAQNLDLIDRLEEQNLNLEVAREEAVSANEAKSAFLASVTHEIRTPMNGLLGFAGLLQKGRLDDTQREYVEVIEKSGKNLLSIINDILDMSSIEANKLQIRRSLTDLDKCLSDSVTLLQPLAMDKGLQLSYESQGVLPDMSYIDPVRVHEVMINLIGNAIKYTSAGCIKVKVKEQSRTKSEVTFRIAVYDDGPGIKKEDQARIFEPFVQLPPVADQGTEGTGIGLVISQRLVELMGGHLAVESKEGAGSVFWFTLKSPVLLHGKPKLMSDDSLCSFSGERVLVVDDSEINLRLLETLLEGMNVRVVKARDGEQAVKQALSQEFALVLMDIRMPKMDGIEATRLIRQKLPADKHLPILALTASSAAAECQQILQAGLDDCLTKPISEIELNRMLKRWLAASV